MVICILEYRQFTKTRQSISPYVRQMYLEVAITYYGVDGVNTFCSDAICFT
jgi:hypothetical protein